MFSFRKLAGLFFVGLLIFGLFGAFGRNDNRHVVEAYRQGFVDGQQAAAGAEAGTAKTAVPDGMPGANIYIRDHGFFFHSFGFLLLCLVPLFALGLLFLGGGRRRRHGRGWSGHPCGGGTAHWKQRSWGQQESSGTEKSPEDIDDGPPEPIKQA